MRVTCPLSAAENKKICHFKNKTGFGHCLLAYRKVYFLDELADKSADAARIAALDKVTPVKFEHVDIVGIDREAKVLDMQLDNYVKLFENALSAAPLSEPLKTQVRAGFDVVTVKGMSVLRMRAPNQSGPSFLGDECFFRAGSSTIRATGPQIAAISKLFAT